MTTARPAAPGDLGCDYSGARPHPAATRKAGGRFVIRYSAGAGNNSKATQWKLCGPHEIRDAVAGGLDFIANSEWTTGRISEGDRAGAADGAADLRFWRSRGLARGATIYVSWDTAPRHSKWRQTDRYLKAYGRALRGYYRVGCYAGTPYLKHALKAKIITHGWRPNAGSWSGDGLPFQPNLGGDRRKVMLRRAQNATPAAIFQTGNRWWHKSADENLMLRPAGTHLQALAAARRPPAKRPVAPVKPPARPRPAPSRPPAAKTPAKPPAAATGPYSPGVGHSNGLVSGNRQFVAYLADDGHIRVNRLHKKHREI